MDIKTYVSRTKAHDGIHNDRVESLRKTRSDQRKTLDAHYVVANYDVAIGDIVTNSKTGETIRITSISVDASRDCQHNYTLICQYYGVCLTKKLADRKDGQQGWCNQNLVSKHIKAGDL